MNKVILCGRLTRPVEIKTTASGKLIGHGSLATNRVWKDANGQKQQKVEYHSLVVMGASADIIKKYTDKGSQLLIEGTLTTRQWDGNDGQKRKTTEVMVREFEFLDNKKVEATGNNYQDEGTMEQEKLPTSTDEVEAMDIEEIPVF